MLFRFVQTLSVLAWQWLAPSSLSSFSSIFILLTQRIIEVDSHVKTATFHVKNHDLSLYQWRLVDAKSHTNPLFADETTKTRTPLL